MLYTHANTTKAKVFDVDTKEEFRRVLEVCTDEGWIKVHKRDGLKLYVEEIATEKIRFQSIHAIKGLESKPCLFHCYGRIN